MYLLIILVYLVIGIPEIVGLRRKKQIKEIWIYSVIIVFAFIISLLLIAGVHLPRPMDIIGKMFESFPKLGGS